MTTNEIRIPATLESARTYRTKEGLWLMELVYTYEAKDGTHRFTIPACELPVHPDLVAIDVDEQLCFDYSFYGPYFKNTAVITPRDDIKLHKGYVDIFNDEDKRSVNVIWQDQLIKPRVEEMTVEEIEKKLGYKIKIVNKK